MKKVFLSIILSSLISFIVYWILSSFLNAIFKEIFSEMVAFYLVLIFTAIIYSFSLLLLNKRIKNVCEKEVMKDYENGDAFSFANEISLVFKHEKKCVITVFSIVLICYIINKADFLIFGKKTFSFITFIFSPLYLFGTAFSIDFIGYVLNAVLICFLYLVFVFIFRKKKYNEWLK